MFAVVLLGSLFCIYLMVRENIDEILAALKGESSARTIVRPWAARDRANARPRPRVTQSATQRNAAA